MCKTKAELNELVAQRRKLVAKKKKITDQLAEVDADIIEYVQRHGVSGGKAGSTLIVFGDDYKISYIKITKHPLDTDRVKAYLGDLVDGFLTESTSNRLDIR
jgi:hypothetical protein